MISKLLEIFADSLFFKLETCDNDIYLKKVNAFVDKLNANDGANASEAIRFFDWEDIFQLADAALLKQEFKMLIEYKKGCLADADENVKKMTAMAEEIAVIKKQLESLLKIQDDKLASDKPSASLTMFAKK